MTRPDEPAKPVTSADLEAVRGAAADYIYECADDIPLTEAEQVLAMAIADVMPSAVREHFGDTEQARLAWVVASCCFLRLRQPDNPRKAAPALYALLDQLEMTAPAAWAETYQIIDRVLRDGGLEMDDFDPDERPA